VQQSSVDSEENAKNLFLLSSFTGGSVSSNCFSVKSSDDVMDSASGIAEIDNVALNSSASFYSNDSNEENGNNEKKAKKQQQQDAGISIEAFAAPLQWRGYTWRRVNSNLKTSSLAETKMKLLEGANQLSEHLQHKKINLQNDNENSDDADSAAHIPVSASEMNISGFASRKKGNRAALHRRQLSNDSESPSPSLQESKRIASSHGQQQGIVNSSSRLHLLRQSTTSLSQMSTNSANVASRTLPPTLTGGSESGSKRTPPFVLLEIDNHDKFGDDIKGSSLNGAFENGNFPHQSLSMQDNEKQSSTKGNNSGILQKAKVFLNLRGLAAYDYLFSSPASSTSKSNLPTQNPPLSPTSTSSSVKSAPSNSVSPGKNLSPSSPVSFISFNPASKLSSRRCRFLSAIGALLLLLALGALSIVFGVVTVWGIAHTEDPCRVATANAKLLVDNPRVDIPGFEPVLPKIVHQQWKTDKIPEGKYTEWHEKWLRLFPQPEYTHILWDDISGRKLIADHYPWFLDIYDSYQFNIQRADAVRYFILHRYGGIYADLDYEPLVNFYDHLPQDRASFIESPYQYNEYLQNSLMSSPAKDPFWLTVFDVLVERHNAPVLKATGPMFLDEALKRAKHPYHSLPCENFQRLPFHQHLDETSPFMSRLHREILGRLYPMKSCGNFHDPVCHFGRHHNTASYLPETGVINLLWA